MISNTDPFAHQAVRLADLDKAFPREVVTGPASSAPIRQAAPDPLERALAGAPVHPLRSPVAQNDWIGVPPSSWKAPHPIGSTLPGPLGEEEMPPGVKPARRTKSRRPVADVPRLPQGVVLRWPVRFDATGPAYARLWAGHMLLMVLTLGLAWPWVVQRRERFFLRHTQVAGQRMDFRLDATAIWPRFAMGLALVLGVAGAAVGSPRAGLGALTLAALVWPLLAYLSVHQKVVSLSWAGRRLWFEGPWHGAYRAFGASILMALGGVWLTALAWDRSLPVPWWAAAGCWAFWMLSVPVAAWAHLRYRQHHVRLGPFKLIWKVTRRDFFKACARSLAWAGVVALGLAGVNALVLSGLLIQARLAGQAGVSMPVLGWMVGLSAAAMLMLVWPHAHARLTNLVWSKTGNRHLRFRSDISPGAHVRQFLKNAVRLLLTGGLYWPWAVVNLRRQRMQSLQIWSRVDAEVLLAHWPTHHNDTAPVAVPPVSIMPTEGPTASSLVATSGLHRVRA